MYVGGAVNLHRFSSAAASSGCCSADALYQPVEKVLELRIYHTKEKHFLPVIVSIIQLVEKRLSFRIVDCVYLNLEIGNRGNISKELYRGVTNHLPFLSSFGNVVVLLASMIGRTSTVVLQSYLYLSDFFISIICLGTLVVYINICTTAVIVPVPQPCRVVVYQYMLSTVVVYGNRCITAAVILPVPQLCRVVVDVMIDFFHPNILRNTSSLGGTLRFRCGPEDVEIDKYGTGICDKPCGGDIDLICGGYHAFTAYTVGESYNTPCLSTKLGKSSRARAISDIVMFSPFKRLYSKYNSRRCLAFRSSCLHSRLRHSSRRDLCAL